MTLDMTRSGCGFAKLTVVGRRDLLTAYWALPLSPLMDITTPIESLLVDVDTVLTALRPTLDRSGCISPNKFRVNAIYLPGCPWFRQPLWPRLTQPTTWARVAPGCGWLYQLRLDMSHGVFVTEGWATEVVLNKNGETFSVFLKPKQEWIPWTN